MVNYEEKMYAAGKIPGGFNKREGRPGEDATLTSRLIDRPIRPLFPKGYRHDVQVISIVMSVDPNCSPEIDRKSTRLNSSHVSISYAVVCLKNKTSIHRC